MSSFALARPEAWHVLLGTDCRHTPMMSSPALALLRAWHVLLGHSPAANALVRKRTDSMHMTGGTGVDADLYNEQLCLGVAHGLAYAAENGNGIIVTPIMQDQPQQICIPILPGGHCFCKRQDKISPLSVNFRVPPPSLSWVLIWSTECEMRKNAV